MRPVTLLLRAALPAVMALVTMAALGTLARGGVAPYTDPGKIDFDTAMELLNPYGTWARVDGKWTWTPLDHAAPYTNGRWLYTEFGWYWQGHAPQSWVTEHYGYWKRNAARVWTWYPCPDWLPQTVEMRASADGVGWRSGEVDRDGNFVEPSADRLTKIDEWTFVTPAQFAGPITPAIIARGGVAEQLLEESITSLHSYLTYRPIERPGPHPADFVNLGDGRMFPPMTAKQRQAALRPKTPVPPPAPNDDGPPDDKRQVAYWATLFLPTRWTPVPPDAKYNELYIYRPDFFQDQDGIERRIALWLDPKLRSSEAFHLRDVLSHHPPGPAATNGPGTAPAAAAGNRLANPFEESSPPPESTKTPAPPAVGNRAGTSTNAAPDGRAAQP